MQDQTYYLAVDIGASSGRHILGHLEGGKLALEEMHRFENGMKEVDGHFTWDIEALFNEIVQGLVKCREANKIPVSMGIDTWGGDYVLLDGDRKEITPAFAYRDARGGQSVAAVEEVLPYAALYAKTGIPRQPFNTIYQLWHDKQAGRLGRAAHMLMLPEYFHWRLTGVMRREYTNATTTGLVNADTGAWDGDILAALGYPARLFGEIHRPGEAVGAFTEEMQRRVGFDCQVVLPGTHDTASAVAACPCKGQPLYISSGTWSLMGTELDAPLRTEECRAANFTNEGGANGKIRFLKNIMGLWMLQCIKREQLSPVTYDQLMEMARASAFDGSIDLQDPAFLAPRSMTEAVRAHLGQPALPLADVVRTVYHSLARCYAQTAREIEALCGQAFPAIHIFGGGSGDRYLNELTARYSGKQVIAGPKEATAMGNLLVQMAAAGVFPS